MKKDLKTSDKKLWQKAAMNTMNALENFPLVVVYRCRRFQHTKTTIQSQTYLILIETLDYTCTFLLQPAYEEITLKCNFFPHEIRHVLLVKRDTN